MTKCLERFFIEVSSHSAIAPIPIHLDKARSFEVKVLVLNNALLGKCVVWELLELVERRPKFFLFAQQAVCLPHLRMISNCYGHKGEQQNALPLQTLIRNATVLENSGKSWNWGKKFPGPGKSLSLGHVLWKSWNEQNIYFFILKMMKIYC